MPFHVQLFGSALSDVAAPYDFDLDFDLDLVYGHGLRFFLGIRMSSFVAMSGAVYTVYCFHSRFHSPSIWRVEQLISYSVALRSLSYAFSSPPQCLRLFRLGFSIVIGGERFSMPGDLQRSEVSLNALCVRNAIWGCQPLSFVGRCSGLLSNGHFR